MGSFKTIPLKDAANNQFLQQVYDVSNNNTGPLINVSLISVPSGLAYTDRSGSVIVGGQSQQIAAAVVAPQTRPRFFVKNPKTAAGQGIPTPESLFINFTDDATVDGIGSIELEPGGLWDSGWGGVTAEKINVTSNTAGHRWVAKEIIV